MGLGRINLCVRARRPIRPALISGFISKKRLGLLRREYNRRTRRKISRSRVQNHRTQSTCEVKSRESNPGRIGGRRVLSLLRLPCSIKQHKQMQARLKKSSLFYHIFLSFARKRLNCKDVTHSGNQVLSCIHV